MTPEEIRALAMECGAYPDVGYVAKGEILFHIENLAAYTAAVEERCAKICDSRVPPDARHGTTDVEDESRACAEAIRETIHE